MKKALKALWHGIKAVFTALVDWVATLFGMNDNSKYSRRLRRIVSTAFTVTVTAFAVVLLIKLASSLYEDFACNSDDDGYLSEQLSDDIAYYEHYYDNNGYLLNAKGKKVLEEVAWIAKPLDGDSLVCYSDGELRGYFHRRDGRMVIKPTYRHAWIFSDGRAAVESGGRVKFIDTTGQVVIDHNFTYDISVDGYVFHNGHCAVTDSTGHHMGLIDRNGNWILQPVYRNIIPVDTFWLASLDNRQTVLTFSLDTVIPLTEAEFEIRDTAIFATFADHTKSTYSLQGELITANQIYDIDQLMYETREVVYPERIKDDEDYYSSDEPYFRKAAASCLRYEADYGWYGLMTLDGKPLTPPSYVNIEAIDKDLFLCETTHGHGVLLNSRGQRVQ